MQCTNLLRKRSLGEETWSCTSKRMCLEAALQSLECPMDTSHSFLLTNQHEEQQIGFVRPRPAAPSLCCPRCLGGEPGHINHIMGL